MRCFYVVIATGSLFMLSCNLNKTADAVLGSKSVVVHNLNTSEVLKSISVIEAAINGDINKFARKTDTLFEPHGETRVTVYFKNEQPVKVVGMRNFTNISETTTFFVHNDSLVLVVEETVLQRKPLMHSVQRTYVKDKKIACILKKEKAAVPYDSFLDADLSNDTIRRSSQDEEILLENHTILMQNYMDIVEHTPWILPVK